MILCSCTGLSDHDLSRTLREALGTDPEALMTPGRVFHANDCPMRCGECARLVHACLAAELARLRSGQTDPGMHNNTAGKRGSAPAPARTGPQAAARMLG